jgi:hypothetical protein
MDHPKGASSDRDDREDLCILMRDSHDLLDLVIFWEISGGF